MPDSAQTSAKATKSPGPTTYAQANVPIASAMPASQVACRPQRCASRAHIGMLQAAATKYSASSTPDCCSICSRSATKNSTSDAGTAAAIPLATKIASSHRKPRSDSGATMARHGETRADSAATGRRGARFTSATRAIASVPRNSAISACGPHVDSSDARITPTSPKPSRHAVTRARPLSSSASRAPHAWYAIEASE